MKTAVARRRHLILRPDPKPVAVLASGRAKREVSRPASVRRLGLIGEVFMLLEVFVGVRSLQEELTREAIQTHDYRFRGRTRRRRGEGFGIGDSIERAEFRVLNWEFHEIRNYSLTSL